MKGLKYFLENINEAVKTPEEWMHDEDSVLVRLPGNPSVDHQWSNNMDRSTGH